MLAGKKAYTDGADRDHTAADKGFTVVMTIILK